MPSPGHTQAPAYSGSMGAIFSAFSSSAVGFSSRRAFTSSQSSLTWAHDVAGQSVGASHVFDPAAGYTSGSGTALEAEMGRPAAH